MRPVSPISSCVCCAWCLPRCRHGPTSRCFRGKEGAPSFPRSFFGRRTRPRRRLSSRALSGPRPHYGNSPASGPCPPAALPFPCCRAKRLPRKNLARQEETPCTRQRPPCSVLSFRNGRAASAMRPSILTLAFLTRPFHVPALHQSRCGNAHRCRARQAADRASAPYSGGHWGTDRCGGA